MEVLKKNIRHRGKTKWVDTITKEDINSLPLILVGLNYQKYFPVPVPDGLFTRSFKNQNPDLVFSKSQFSNKTVASGVKKAKLHVDLVNMVHYHEYKEDSGDFSHLPVNVDFSPSDKSEVAFNNLLQGTDLTNLDEIEQAFLQDKLDHQPEIINIKDEEETLNPQALNNTSRNDSLRIDQVIHQDLTDVDKATLSLINTIQINDKIQAGEDEDTINLVTKLDDESKAEEANY